MSIGHLRQNLAIGTLFIAPEWPKSYLTLVDADYWPPIVGRERLVENDVSDLREHILRIMRKHLVTFLEERNSTLHTKIRGRLENSSSKSATETYFEG